MRFVEFFQPSARHEGVRPVHILGLRLFYGLMAAFVATNAWGVLLAHRGPWEPFHALAWCVWAAYPTLALLGLFRPLRMLPIMFFTIGYKALWFAFVAYPAWRAGTLAGSPIEPITDSFLALPLLVLVVPWGYAWRTYGWSGAGATVRAARA